MSKLSNEEINCMFYTPLFEVEGANTVPQVSHITHVTHLSTRTYGVKHLSTASP